ncbi:MAG: transposase family protein [Prevotella sp.]|nr:transposase family protein [Alistipes senegalensis]MCM1357427.1 transposase family protein [Prevotella sp.]MCM1473138.1 transposase family protein [Muribaculaceae bacterium]
MKSNGITEYFEEVELYEKYNGYFCSVADVITIVILGSICGLKNVKQIHQWVVNNRVSEFLNEEFGITQLLFCGFGCICLCPKIKGYDDFS